MRRRNKKSICHVQRYPFYKEQSQQKRPRTRLSLSRRPNHPDEAEKGVKSRLLLAERSNEAGQNAVARNQEETPDDANEDVLVSVEMTSETAREKAARAKTRRRRSQESLRERVLHALRQVFTEVFRMGPRRTNDARRSASRRVVIKDIGVIIDGRRAGRERAIGA